MKNNPSYRSKTRNPCTSEEQYQAYKAKMLAPFFKKHKVVVVGNDFDSAFSVLQQRSPELFDNKDHEK